MFRIIMLLLDAIEEVGSVENWPTSILTTLFAFDPRMPFALSHFQTIIAFFYGSGIPLSMACQFFAACSFHPLILEKPHFSYLYETWSRSPSNSRCLYYDMDEGRYKYTDGTYMSEVESLTPDIGFNGTGFPTLILSILRQLSLLELVED
jgi:uncharacterized membrane protein YkgB